MPLVLLYLVLLYILFEGYLKDTVIFQKIVLVIRFGFSLITTNFLVICCLSELSLAFVSRYILNKGYHHKQSSVECLMYERTKSSYLYPVYRHKKAREPISFLQQIIVSGRQTRDMNHCALANLSQTYLEDR